MKQVEVTMVRVYLTESEAHMGTLIKRLNDWGKVRGLAVFRGVAGFGRGGEVHSSELLDKSADLPLAVEFFDTPDKAAAMINYVYDIVGPGRIVSWPAFMTADDVQK